MRREESEGNEVNRTEISAIISTGRFHLADSSRRRQGYLENGVMENKIAMVAILCGMLAAVFRHNKWIAIPALLVGFAIGLLALFGAFD